VAGAERKGRRADGGGKHNFLVRVACSLYVCNMLKVKLVCGWLLWVGGVQVWLPS